MSELVQNPIKSKLSANQIKFAKWLALPTAKRKPTTQAELADTLKVNCATLSVWKTIPELRARIDEEIARWADEEDAEVIEAMILTAQTPGKNGTADRKLYLQWRGKLVEKVEGKLEVTDPYSEAIKRARAERGLIEPGS